MNHIICRNENGIFEIEIDRLSKKNALTESMYAELAESLVQAENDSATKVVLIYGQPFCFTAGNDLKDFVENPPEDSNAPVFQFLRTMAKFSKPIICAINGPAVGIGTTMCLHADLVYCGESARFQMPFVRLGLVPEFASSYLIPRLTGHVKAFEMLVLGDAFGVTTALELGMINEVFDDETYLTAAKQKAVELAALPTAAVIATKKLLKQTTMSTVLKVIDVEADVFSERLQSTEAKEKFAAFFKK